MIQRVGYRTFFAGLATVCSLWLSSTLRAQDPQARPLSGKTRPVQTAIADPPAGQQAQSPEANKVPRPNTDRFPADYQLTPELKGILKAWGQHTAGIKRMQGKFQKYEYNSVFRVEKRATGYYYYEAPDQGRMDFIADKSVQPPNNKHMVGDVEYTILPADSESWICDGKQLLSIQIDKKQYDRITIPEEFRGEAIKNSPLPFLFGMDADEFEKRYLMQLGAMHEPDGSKTGQSRIHIVAYPLMAQQRREFQKAEVLLNPETYFPIAVKLFDPSGNKETVYIFQEHDEVSFPWLQNKFNVNLWGYKLMNDEQAAPRETSNHSSIFDNSPVERTAQEKPGTLAR